MTTDATVRTALDIDPASPGANQVFADAINAATHFAPAVTADDVPAILAFVRQTATETPAFETGLTYFISILIKQP
jgi:hypothetical protein